MMNKNHIFLFVLTFLAIEILLITFVDYPVSVFMRLLDETNPHLINFFRGITDFAKSKWYLWPSGIGIILCIIFFHTLKLEEEKRRRLAVMGHNLIFFFSSIAISGIVTDILKPILGRGRPVEMVRDHLYSFHPFTFHAAWNGMPSGHATTAAALTTTLILLFPRGKIVWVLLGLTLALSRIMVNAHYLSDVLAGIVVGNLITIFLDRFRSCEGMFPFLHGIFPIDKFPLSS